MNVYSDCEIIKQKLSTKIETTIK